MVTSKKPAKKIKAPAADDGVPVTIKMPQPLLRVLDELAVADGRSRASFCRKLIHSGLAAAVPEDAREAMLQRHGFRFVS